MLNGVLGFWGFGVLWDNQLTALPEEIRNLKNLKELYLQRNPVNGVEQEKIRAWLPDCHITF